MTFKRPESLNQVSTENHFCNLKENSEMLLFLISESTLSLSVNQKSN